VFIILRAAAALKIPPSADYHRFFTPNEANTGSCSTFLRSE
jgi:hypothetical protein